MPGAASPVYRFARPAQGQPPLGPENLEKDCKTVAQSKAERRRNDTDVGLLQTTLELNFREERLAYSVRILLPVRGREAHSQCAGDILCSPLKIESRAFIEQNKYEVHIAQTVTTPKNNPL